MYIIKPGEIAPKVANIPLFTGGEVTYQRLIGKDMGKDYNALQVNFSKGSRNKFHAHTSDQILIVTAGKGQVVTEKEQRVVGVGDIILIPAGEKHWHGATKDSDFSHIALELAGTKVTQLED